MPEQIDAKTQALYSQIQCLMCRKNPAPVVDPERDHVPVPAVQNPDPGPVFPRQNHVQVSTNQAAQPQSNAVSL